jgi:cellulose synthase/poly-beta-1,6-N-acetylglucosamine synthase-like glycosyltransferase
MKIKSDAPKQEFLFWILFNISVGIPIAVIIAAFNGQLVIVLGLSLVTVAYDVIQWALVLRFAWLNATKPRFPQETGENPTIGVIIPAWNEEKALPDTLATVLTQNDPPELIIVADDGSTDNTLQHLEKLYQLESDGKIAKSRLYPNLWILCKEHSGKGDSLNQGIFLSNTDVVLVLDADTKLAPNSIKAVRQSFREYPSLTVVGGTLVPCCSDTVLGRIFQFFQRYEYARTHVWRLAWSYLNASLIVSGACAAFKRETLLEIGGFNSKSWVEDYEIMFRLQSHLRLQKRPCRIMVNPQLLVQTESPDTIESFLRQRRRWGGGFLETILWYRKMVGDPRLGVLGYGYLVHNVLTVANVFYSVAWLIAGLILFWQEKQTHTYLFLSLLFLIVIAITISVLTINLYRYYFKRGEVWWGGTLFELFLRPFFYLQLVIMSYIWGYFSCLVQRKTW